jgi:N-hydroxyarylamine O-acetyltransferase
VTDSNGQRLDLDAYFARIGYAGRPAADLATLKALHVAHATHIPFENFDVLAGHPIRLDVPSLADKLVRRRRGGYCFEQNMLLAAALDQLGFRLKRLQARVRMGAARVLPRTHMALEVEADGQPWLADAGFGGWGLIEPIQLSTGQSRQFAWPYRLEQQDGYWVLQAPQGGQWQDLYAFTRDDFLPVDYEPPNFYVSMHPDSIFRQGLIAQRPTPDVRYLLRGRELIVATREAVTTRSLDDAAEVRGVLAESFGLVAPDDVPL